MQASGAGSVSSRPRRRSYTRPAAPPGSIWKRPPPATLLRPMDSARRSIRSSRLSSTIQPQRRGGPWVAAWKPPCTTTGYCAVSIVFSDYGHISNTDTRTITGAIPGFPNGLSIATTNDLRLRTHSAMFGLAYKFGDPILDAGLAGPPTGLVYKAAWSAPRPSWTGFYLGGDVGMRAVQDDPSLRSATFVSSLNPVPFDELQVCQGDPTVHCVLDQRANGLAFRFSPHAGYNWQFARDWVAGIEGDVGLGNQKTTLSGEAYPGSRGFINAGLFFFGDPHYNFSVETKWDASVRARLGYLVSPTTLLYGTVGPEWMSIKSTSTCSSLVSVSFPGVCVATGETPAVISHATTALGYTIGGGIESMLTANWILRAEYRYANFGNISTTDVRSFPGGSTETVGYRINPTTHTLAVGVSYKLPPITGN